MAEKIIKLEDLKKEDVPEDFRAQTYFDFAGHPFEHQKLFEQTKSVYDAILAINKYAVEWLSNIIAQQRPCAKVFKNETPHPVPTIGNFEVLLEDGAVFEPSRIIGSIKADQCYTIYLAKGAKLIGADIYLEQGDIYVGGQSVVEAGVGIKGPVIIGEKNAIRQNAYLRGGCILGNDCIVRAEIKNSVLMDKANFPHPSYLGDSLCGYMTHFGNEVTSANIGIFAGLAESDKRKSLIVCCDGKAYDFGRPKMGICMGDYCQVGCNSVSDPGTFLKPYTIVYPLTRISRGFYGPNEILKNKPLEHGIIERTTFKPPK